MLALNSVRGSIRLRHVALEKITLFVFLGEADRLLDAGAHVFEHQQLHVRSPQEIDNAPSWNREELVDANRRYRVNGWSFAIA
jgi:hypothetical protein